ncbi:MAG: hypothetical protein IT374_04625 [Polyangiaceae bacterium]|nr:hypothetical protein [Polyangiaceae bacterium]
MMSKPAALVATALAVPLVVFGCGGAEWHPVAGPTVIPSAPAPELPRAAGHGMQKKRAKHHDDDDDAKPPPPPPAASSAAPAASGSASAAPAASAPKPPPKAHPKKKQK